MFAQFKVTSTDQCRESAWLRNGFAVSLVFVTEGGQTRYSALSAFGLKYLGLRVLEDSAAWSSMPTPESSL
jgi:hypothetical protein